MKFDLKALAREYGAKNLRVIMPAQRMSYRGFIPGILIANRNDLAVPNIEFAFDESMYKLENGSKMKLIPVVEEQRATFASQTYYICDFESIVSSRSGIRLMLLTIDGYSTLFYNQETTNV